MSISTTSGRVPADRLDGLGAVGGLGDHLDARRRPGSSGSRPGPAPGRRRSPRAAAAVMTRLQRDDGADAVAAAEPRAGVEGAAVDGEPFAQADQAAPVAAWRAGRRADRRCRRPRPAVRPRRSPRRSAPARRAACLTRVGQRLLHHPVRGQFDARRQRRAARRRRPARPARPRAADPCDQRRPSRSRPGCGASSASGRPSGPSAPSSAGPSHAAVPPSRPGRRPPPRAAPRGPGRARCPSPCGRRRPGSTIMLTLCVTTSCSSRAIRARSCSTAPRAPRRVSRSSVDSRRAPSSTRRRHMRTRRAASTGISTSTATRPVRNRAVRR